MTREEWVARLRSQSTAFARGKSRFRGVTRHHQGNWEARISGVPGVRYVVRSTSRAPVAAVAGSGRPFAI